MAIDKIRRRLRTVRYATRMLSKTSNGRLNIIRLARKTISVGRSEGLSGIKTRIVTLALALQSKDGSALLSPPLTYEAWLDRFDILKDQHLRAAKAHHRSLDLPEIRIVSFIGHSDVPLVGRMVEGWRSSIHERWNAVLVLPNDLSESETSALRARLADEPNITISKGGARLEALLAENQPTLLCRGPVLLNPLSLYMLIEAAVRTGASLVYADNDRMDGDGVRRDPQFKPQYSPLYLSHFNYIGDCVLVAGKPDLDREPIGAASFEDPEAFDRLIAAIGASGKVEHVPFVLYHMLRTVDRRARPFPAPSDHGPSVSIIIPTKDGVGYLRPCIESILEKTSYARDLFEVIVLDNNSKLDETRDYFGELSRLSNVRVIAYPHKFNFSKINNFGAQQTERDILVFLNNDTVVIDPQWLSKLVAQAQREETGVVGGKLLFPDGTLQHAGCAAGVGMGTIRHLSNHRPAEDIVDRDHTREMTVMTGACFAIRRSVFWDVGGFDPILAITWNDAKLCLDCLAAGYRNIYIADPLLIHDESKTRERDNTRETMARFFDEAHYTRSRYRSYFFDDPSYSPNLSAERAGDLAEPPRVRRPWLRAERTRKKILVLSSVYKLGFGVPLVIQQHVRKLVELGYEIVIGGPVAEREFAFPGCERVELSSSKEAAVYAFCNDVDLIVCHTPPFFTIPTLIGGHIPVLSYDYGEPSADFFPEPTRSYLIEVEDQKRSAASLTTQLAAISQAVKDETINDRAVVVGLANSHLPAWSPMHRPRRQRVRQATGWEDRFVVLTVCRFSENERVYKGLDKIARMIREFAYLYPEKADRMAWALAGAGSAHDVAQVEALGFTVFPNVPDEELTDLYTAADAYLGFSRWEGYNLGISQALAMGLPTLASDIPAHREFPIATTGSVLAACKWLTNEVDRQDETDRNRKATVYDWEVSSTKFADLVAITLAG
ncbi:glycosyltransferase [Fulvimarina endophytica]|nr:glycosyltransferase [Fulvimarina endophytica]